MLIHKTNECPKCGGGHINECFATYENGSYCFSCGYSTFNKTDYSYKPQLVTQASCYVPDNIINDIPQMSLDIQEWLCKYYITKDLMKKYSIGYVPFDKFTLKSGREFCGESLIMPTVIENKVVFYQRRFFPEKQILSVGDNKAIFIAEDKESSTIVLTEDYFSAIRVVNANESVAAIPLLGTNLKPHILNYIINRFTNFIVWLDDDMPGKEGTNKLHNTLLNKLKYKLDYKNTNFSIHIVNNKEPKKLTNTQICTTLKEIYQSGDS